MTLISAWYNKSKWVLLFSPLALIFSVVVRIRRNLYRYGILKSLSIRPVVIVVGNITVGGTGKSPMVAYIAKLLMKKNIRVGLVSRGYGGKSSHSPQFVTQESNPSQVGDEAVMLVQQTSCPMVVGRRRADAVELLIKRYELDCVISDDGLQHYALDRDIEIIMMDEKLGGGNGWMLPVGPLREPMSRLNQADFIVKKGGEDNKSYFGMQLSPLHVINAVTNEIADLSDFEGREVSAVAGIGYPQGFFSLLRKNGLVLNEFIFSDHHLYVQKDFLNLRDSSVIMLTQKDAVKCLGMMDDRFWVVVVEADLSGRFDDEFLERYNSLKLEVYA